jgi:uncharacterized protein
MQIDVNDILRHGEGFQLDYDIEAERPELEGITLASPISGSIHLVGVDDGIMVGGRLAADIELECDRCLRAFNHHLEFPLEASFSELPEDDQFPIDKHGKIDLSESLRQEIEVHLPVQRLCQADCSGLELKQKKDNHGSS